MKVISSFILHPSSFGSDEARELECDHGGEQQHCPKRDPAQIPAHRRILFAVVDRLRRGATEGTTISTRCWTTVDPASFANHRCRRIKCDRRACGGCFIRFQSWKLPARVRVSRWSRPPRLLLLTRGLAPALRA